MPIGTQQLRFMLNLAEAWPKSMTAFQAYNESRYEIPRGSQRPGFIMILIDRDFVERHTDAVKDEDSTYKLTRVGWEFLIEPNRKWLYKAAYREWFNTIRPQLNRHILRRGGQFGNLIKLEVDDLV